MEDLKNKNYWIYDENYEWLPGRLKEIISNDEYILETIIDGRYISKQINTKKTPLNEVHPSCLLGVDDLLLLGDFDKQAMLHNTRKRFSEDKIYSFIGTPILIAVNPYKKLKIYSNDIMKSHKDFVDRQLKNPLNEESPHPHLYYIAEAAYQDMIIDKKNQSIVISGESGSGKTESTKIILKYLASSSMNVNDLLPSKEKNEVSVEKQVIDSNPLLEAFGNAKTVRNNNSSRFGKFIQVNFTENGKIISAKIYNYLLEKSRVVNINENERSYHIFYQLIKGSNDQEKEKFYIKDLDYYRILRNGCYDNTDQNDEEDFLITKECMRKLNLKPEELNYIFSVVMGILYIGNLEFNQEDTSLPASLNEESEEDLKIASQLIGIDDICLMTILTKKKMIDAMSKNIIFKINKIEMVYNCRDALCKALYSNMFDYLVKRINAAISNQDEKEKIGIEKDKFKKIGILDIFGFENFEVNSFEQLCINYANERLQQFFNNHIFKLEQEEYKKEGIDFTQVEFVDNKNIIELIDDIKSSIFALLDSESFIPNANDSSFREKVYKYLKKNSCLGDEVKGYLSINHFAGEVYYKVNGFIEKNLDQLTVDILEAMEKSKNKLVKKIFTLKEKEKEDEKKKKGVVQGNKIMSDSLSKQFKRQLDDLIKMLIQSNPRFVKCIKPNSNKSPNEFNSSDVCFQLLSAGVLEAIKIRKQGYSIRRTQDEFIKRYIQLIPQFNYGDRSLKEVVQYFVKALSVDEDIKKLLNSKKSFQIGNNKVYMKEDVRNALEYKLNRLSHINKINAYYKGYKVRKNVWKYLNSIKKVQSHIRKLISKKKYIFLSSLVRIQLNYKHFLSKRLIFYHLNKLSNEAKRIKYEEERIKTLKKKEDSNLTSIDTNPTYNNSEQQDNIDIEKVNKKLERNESIGILKKGKKEKNNIYDPLITESKYEKMYNEIYEKYTKLTLEYSLSYENLIKKEELLIEKDKEIESLKRNLNQNSFSKEVNFLEDNIDTIQLSRKIPTQTTIKSEKNLSYINNAKEEAQIEVLTKEIKRLKKELNETQSNYENLKFQSETIQNKIKEYESNNENSKSHIHLIKQNYQEQIDDLLIKVEVLEKEKRDINKGNLHKSTDKLPIINTVNKDKIKEIKKNEKDKKELKKQSDQIGDQEIKIQELKNKIIEKEKTLREKEAKISELEICFQSEEMKNKGLIEEIELQKEQLLKLKIKFDEICNDERIEEYEKFVLKITNESKENIKKLNEKIIILTNDNENHITTIENMKKMEDTLKSIIISKDRDYDRIRLDSNLFEKEITKLDFEVMKLKKEIKILQITNDRQQKEINDEKEIEKVYYHQMNVMNEQVNRYKKKYDNSKNDIKKCKKSNQLMVSILQLKKQEVSIEGLYMATKYGQANDTSFIEVCEEKNRIKELEAFLLKKLSEVNSDDYIFSEEDEEEEENEDSLEDNELNSIENGSEFDDKSMNQYNNIDIKEKKELNEMEKFHFKK